MADVSAANLRAVKTPEDGIAEMQSKAKETLDSFKVKFFRKAGLGSQAVLVAAFEECTVAMLANPEQWLPEIVGGGLYQVTVTAANEDILFTSFNLPQLPGAPKQSANPAVVKDPNWRGPSVLTYPLANGAQKPEQGAGAVREIVNMLGAPTPTLDGTGTRGQDARGQGGGSGPSSERSDLVLLQLANTFERALNESQKNADRQAAETRDMMKTVLAAIQVQTQATAQAKPSKSIGEILAEATPFIAAAGAIFTPMITASRERAAKMQEDMQKAREENQKLLMSMVEKGSAAGADTVKLLGPLVEAVSASSRSLLQNIANLREIQATGDQPSELEGILRAGAGALGEFMAARAAGAQNAPPRQLPAPQQPQSPAQAPEPLDQEVQQEIEYLKSADPNEVLRLVVERIRSLTPAEEIVPSFIRAMQYNAGVAQAVKEAGNALNLIRKSINDDAWLQANMAYVAGLIRQFNASVPK